MKEDKEKTRKKEYKESGKGSSLLGHGVFFIMFWALGSAAALDLAGDFGNPEWAIRNLAWIVSGAFLFSASIVGTKIYSERKPKKDTPDNA